MNNKEVLNSLIQDAQTNSRFIESKTAIIFTIIGAMLIYYLQDIENIIKYYSFFSCLNLDLFILGILCTLTNVFFLFKLIYPMDNPLSKVPQKYIDYPNLYISKTDTRSEKSELEHFETSLSNDKNIEKALILEYIKTSNIRNNKLHYYKKLVFGITIQIILFTIHILVYNLELTEFTTK